LGVFLGYEAFLAKKKHFSAERKNGRFSVIPAWTGSVVILGHFLMVRPVPPSYVENGPNIQIFGSKKHTFVLLHPPRKWDFWPENVIFGPKIAKFGPKLAFSAKYGYFWPI